MQLLNAFSINLILLLSVETYAKQTSMPHKVTAHGHFSHSYPTEELARENTPVPHIDAACGQGNLAILHDEQVACKKVHKGFQCKSTLTALCKPRENLGPHDRRD